MTDTANRRFGVLRLLWQDVTVITVGLVVLGLLWRTIRYGLGFPMWGDEAFIAASVYMRDFAGMARPLEYGQIAPLGFMWGELAVARVLGLSEYALHLLPYLAGLASLLLLWRFARKIFDRWSAMLAVAVFAAAYYPVRHAAEVKPYSSDLLVSLVLMFLAWHAATRPKSAWRWALLIAFGAVSVWLSYPAAFVAGAAGLYLLHNIVRRRDWRRLGPLAAYAVLLGGSFTAMYFTVAGAHARAAIFLVEVVTWRESWPPLTRPWLLPWWFLKIHTGNLLAYPIGGKNFGSSATFLLVIAGSVRLWRSGRRDLLILLLGPLVLNFVAAVPRLYPYGTSARVSLYMAPAFCLLAGLGLATLLKALVPHRHCPNAFRIAACVLAAIVVVGIAIDIYQPYKKDAARRCRRDVRAIAAQTRQGDEWVFFNALGEVEYSPNLLFYGGSGAALRYHVLRYAPVPVRWGPPPDQVSLRRGGRVLFLVYHDNRAKFPQDLYDKYFDALVGRLGQPERMQTYVLTSDEDPKRAYTEQIKVYEFPPAP